jgi:Fe-S-cluster containining protein
MVWTAVHPAMQVYDLIAQLGTVVQLAKGKKVAVLIAPTSYIPAGMPCPALSADNLCTIQNTKPLRCRAMPFYAYRKEEAQGDLLIPHKDWLCDTSDAAPLVYRDKKILDRTDFEAERAALHDSAPTLGAWAQTLLKEYAPLLPFLTKAAMNPKGGRLVMRFAPFLLADKTRDIVGFAKQQHPVLLDFAAKTAGTPALAEHHKFYKDAAADLAWFAARG